MTSRVAKLQYSTDNGANWTRHADHAGAVGHGTGVMTAQGNNAVRYRAHRRGRQRSPRRRRDDDAQPGRAVGATAVRLPAPTVAPSATSS
jgi:hypothetical protein